MLWAILIVLLPFILVLGAVTPTPAFTQSPLLGHLQMSTANTNRDGSTGTYSSAITIGSNGALVDYIRFKATGSTAAGTVRIFVSTDGGSTFRLHAEVATTGVTPSGTLPSEQVFWYPEGGVPWNLPASAQLKFCPNNSETWNVFVHGGNL